MPPRVLASRPKLCGGNDAGHAMTLDELGDRINESPIKNRKLYTEVSGKIIPLALYKKPTFSL